MTTRRGPPKADDHPWSVSAERSDLTDRRRVSRAGGPGPAGELVSVGQLKLSQDCGGVFLHCAGGHGGPCPDLFVRVFGGDEAQHVPLAPGELVELSVEAGRRCSLAEAGRVVMPARPAADYAPRLMTKKLSKVSVVAPGSSPCWGWRRPEWPTGRRCSRPGHWRSVCWR
jgi:hypothetical protein